MRVCALVVTYNRRELLKESLSAIIAQSYPINDLILFDNGSTDGTHDYLEKLGFLKDERIHYSYVEKNIGAAGAYSEAFRIARGIECDWIWEMDDDTIPTPDCLKNLMDALKEFPGDEKVSFLASTVYGENGEFMNVPNVDNRPSENGYPSWYAYLNKGMVKVESATFVSLLVNKQAIDQLGVPLREFYMWGVDTEFTLRLTRYFGSAYFVGGSIAIHKRKNTKALSIEDETDPSRLKAYRTLYESAFINGYIYNWRRSKIKFFWHILIASLKALKLLRKKNGGKMFHERLMGGIMAIKDRKKFERLIDEQIGAEI